MLRSATRRGPGRRPGRRDRQPVRLHPHRDHGHRLRARSARSTPPTASRSRRDPDRRLDQPGQLRRPADRRPGPRDRHQLPDRHRRRRAARSGSASRSRSTPPRSCCPSSREGEEIKRAYLGVEHGATSTDAASPTTSTCRRRGRADPRRSRTAARPTRRACAAGAPRPRRACGGRRPDRGGGRQEDRERRRRGRPRSPTSSPATRSQIEYYRGDDKRTAKVKLGKRPPGSARRAQPQRRRRRQDCRARAVPVRCRQPGLRPLRA